MNSAATPPSKAAIASQVARRAMGSNAGRRNTVQVDANMAKPVDASRKKS